MTIRCIGKPHCAEHEHDRECPMVTGIDPDADFQDAVLGSVELVADAGHEAMRRALAELLQQRVVLHTVAGLQVPGKLTEVDGDLATMVSGDRRYDVPIAYIVTLESSA